MIMSSSSVVQFKNPQENKFKMAGQMPICISFDDNFWEQLIWDEDLSDTTIVVKDTQGKVIWEFKVHSIVLRRRSKVFKELIGKIGDTITFDNVNILVLKKFIKYLYVGDIYVETWEEIVDFLELAVKYEVGSLFGDLEMALIKFVSLVTACDLLEVARKYELLKLDKACMDLIVRGAVIIFGTSGFQRLTSDTLETIIFDHRLNVAKEVDLVMYLVCWAKAVSFTRGNKLDDEGIYKMMQPLLRNVRFDKISVEDQELVPINIRSLVFPKAVQFSPGTGPQESTPIKPDQKRTLKAREPSKVACLMNNYAQLLLRERNSVISWVNTGAGELLVMRFSVTMPIFLGGFLMNYRLNGVANARVLIRRIKSSSDEQYKLAHRNCEHRLDNAMASRDYIQAYCHEPDTPILLYPGDECNVYLALSGATVWEMPRINFPFTSLKSAEGPTFRLHMDSVTAVRKIHFLSACGRCVVTPRD